jgi:hypothetical protein
MRSVGTSADLAPGRLSPKQPLDQLLSAQGEVLGHVTEETRQRPNPQGSMAWDGDVVLATFRGGQSDVATGLAADSVSEIGEGLREIVTGDVPRKPQALMTSSRTKWSRMTPGTLPSSK